MKELQISIKDMVFNLEEILLLKLLEFINYDIPDNELDQINSGENPVANRVISSILAKYISNEFILYFNKLL